MTKRVRPFLPILLAAALAAAIVPTKQAYAQSEASADRKDQEIELLKLQVKQLEQRVNTLEELNQQVKAIDRKVEAQGKTQQVETDTSRAKSLELPIVKAGDEGFQISSPDDFYRIRFAGLLQLNGRFFTSGNNKNVSSTFYVNKARPIISGALDNYYEFQITPDFGQGKAILQDDWLNVAYLPWAQFQMGKYKAAVNMERLQSDLALPLIQRSQVQNLVPNRDIGGQIWGVLFNRRVSYYLALMNGVPNNTASSDFDNNDAKDFVGRIFLIPFRPSENEWLKGLGFGFAASQGNEVSSTLSTYKTWGQSNWFSYNSGVTASGSRTRLDAQGYYYWRQLGLMGEYAQDDDALNLVSKGSKGIPTSITHNFTNTGYMVQLSYFLTGENESYSLVKPLRPFDPINGGWGAWEVAGRVSNVAAATKQFQLGFVNQSVSAKTETEYAVGVNWYLNNNVKYGFDYAYSDFYEGAGTTAVPKNRPPESVFESQLQLAF
jgi:phosphate-selective porin OprO/OprP